MKLKPVPFESGDIEAKNPATDGKRNVLKVIRKKLATKKDLAGTATLLKTKTHLEKVLTTKKLSKKDLEGAIHSLEKSLLHLRSKLRSSAK